MANSKRFIPAYLGETKKRVNFYLSPDVFEKIKVLSSYLGISMSQMVNDILMNFTGFMGDLVNQGILRRDISDVRKAEEFRRIVFDAVEGQFEQFNKRGKKK